MENYKIDYSPLTNTLQKQGKLLSDLNLSSRTIAKIKKNESMTLNTIGRLCAELDVTITEIVIIRV